MIHSSVSASPNENSSLTLQFFRTGNDWVFAAEVFFEEILAALFFFLVSHNDGFERCRNASKTTKNNLTDEN